MMHNLNMTRHTRGTVSRGLRSVSHARSQRARPAKDITGSNRILPLASWRLDYSGNLGTRHAYAPCDYYVT